MVTAAMIAGLSQILLKHSANHCYSKRIREYINPQVMFAYMMLGLSLLLNNLAYRGLQLKDGLALTSLSYFFVLLFSRLFLKERITFRKVVSNMLIIAGVVAFNLT